MNLLVRKIALAKWKQNDISSGEAVSADAITNCLKTKDNELSTWQISERANISDAVLALVSTHEHLDKIDVICLNKSSLEEGGLLLRSTDGKTPVEDLMKTHVDIYNLNYKSLGNVADFIAREIIDGKSERFTVGRLKEIISDAINNGRLQKEDLNENIRKYFT